MTEADVAEYRKSALEDLKIRGKGPCPKPIKHFTQCGLNDLILAVNRKHGFNAPTPIQAQAIPAIMAGRNVIGIAKTGSGKTLAYVLPSLRHFLDQRPLEVGDGPMGMVMAPTRELALQIHAEYRKYSKATGIRSVCIYGGAEIAAQIGELKRGVEVVVCTPGRMIDVLCANNGRVTNLRRVTFLVLDEADRMFDMGFEPQIMKIIENIRPDRQTVMFSATFPKAVEELARKILKKPLEIVVGNRSTVSDTVNQIIEVRGEETKFRRLLEIVKEWYDRGNILIFVDRQDAADQLFRQLTTAGYACRPLHGGMDQFDRDTTLQDFKAHNISLLIATSVAARGLDVKGLDLVLNYNVPSHLEDYVHRVGRTGRAGRKGTAITFVTPEEESHASFLIVALERAHVPVPDDLRKLAESVQKKKQEGQTVHMPSHGWGGKGFKFDETDNKEEMEERKRQKRALGIEEEEEDEDAGDEEDAVGGEGDKKGGKGEEARELTVEELQAAFLGAPIREVLDSVSSNPLADLNPAQQAALQVSAASAGLNQADAQARAQQLMAALAGMKRPNAPGSAKSHFELEIEINDYPQHARWKVTHKDALRNISEWTSAAVTTKGVFVMPGKQPPTGERKLYLLVEAGSEKSVREARSEIKRILDDAMASMASRPDEQRTGKYQVV
jgi:ATP-dependent RNA helicase DDX46/PRP5